MNPTATIGHRSAISLGPSRSERMMVAVAFKPRTSGPKVIRRGATPENFIFIPHSSVMANTFTCLHYHVIFSTRNREPWISRDIEERLWKFLGGIVRGNGMKALQIGGMPDHVHLALALPPTQTVSKALQLLKGGSSKWVKDAFPNLARLCVAGRLCGVWRQQVQFAGGHCLHSKPARTSSNQILSRRIRLVSQTASDRI
jgi:REP element-mobilizing transposase RayT